jgi:16S rRNA (uracil1498-N3)-methyltransferase
MNTGHIPYFFVQDVLFLDPDDAFHFLKVMRGHDGDPLEVSDGRGRHWTAQARIEGKKRVRAEILEELPPESPPSVALASALPKGQRASYLVEKSVEIGISDLFFLFTAFASQKEWNPGILRRMKAVARSAAAQARRAWLPKIHAMVPLVEFLDRHPIAAVLERTGTGEAWSRLASGREEQVLLVGPEGGWSVDEIAIFNSKGLPLLALTDHPLRVETAAVAGLAFYYACRKKTGDAGASS